MKKIINKEGLKFGTLTIIEEIRNDKGKLICCCICDCGNFHQVPYTYLNIGRRKSCPKCGIENRKNGTKSYINNPLYKGSANIPKSLYTTYKLNAIKRNILFNISIDYIEQTLINQNKTCPYTHIKLFLDRKNCNASLDRIDSSLGYVEGNLMWVYKPINVMKKDFTVNYFLELCKLVASNN